MLRSLSTNRSSEDEAGNLTAVFNVTATSGKPVGFRKLSLCLRFIICLKKTRNLLAAKPPVRATNRSSEDEAGNLTAVFNVTATSGKPVGFRQLSLCLRFIICLKKTRNLLAAKPPVRSFSSQSYVVLEVESESDDKNESKMKQLIQIFRKRDLLALEELGGVDGVSSFLNSVPKGSTDDDLGLSVRQIGFWDSFLLFLKEIWNSLWSYTVLFLLIAADLSFSIGSLEQGIEHGWHDGVGILFAVFLLVFIPSVANFHRKREEEKKFLKNKNNLTVSVERGRIQKPVSVSDVKVGDKVHLKEGDHVPADGLFIEGQNLILDEILNPKIDCDQNPFLFSGSVVKRGNGTMIVVSTGAATALGKGLIDVAVNPFEKTLLQSRMNKPYEFFDKFGLMVSIVIALVVLIRLLCGKHDGYYNDRPEMKGKTTVSLMMNIFERIFLKSGGKVSALATVFVAIVIGIQHGMPWVVSVSLFLWEKRIGSFGGKSQNLSACGTMGLVSAICIDITGELSFNKVEVGELWIGKEEIKRDMNVETDHQAILEVLEPATRVLFFDPKTSICLTSDSINLWANWQWKMNMKSPHQKFDIIDHKQLSSKKGIGALMSKSGEDETNLHLHYNGDASTILNMCSQYYDIKGSIHDIENQKHFFEEVIKDLVKRDLKPIAFACKQTNYQEFEEDGMKLLGFVGLKYSCHGIFKAVKDLRSAGVRIVLTSEDELSKAKATAGNLKIFQCDSTNGEVEDEEIRKIMKNDRVEIPQNPSVTVMGNVTPEDKLFLVQGLKDDGHVVAFLGGLTISDAPALRKADVGVTQENWSTEISRTVSDLIIVGVDSLTRILKCGRCAYLNTQKFYRLQMTASISGLLITLVSTMSSGGSPITTLHLIWVTLIMSLLGGLVMLMEWNDEELEAPLKGNRNQSLITKSVLKKVSIHVLYQALVFLLFEYLGQRLHLPGMNEDVWYTMIFNTFILCQIFNMFDAMELVKNRLVFKAVVPRYWFLISVLIIIVMQAMVIEVFGTIVNCVKLSAAQWVICVSFASLTLRLEWGLNILCLILATLFSQFDSIDSNKDL